jgi:hypothetical protein
MFLQDHTFRVKGVVVTTDYKQFGIFLRAMPHIKPQLNKHEL